MPQPRMVQSDEDFQERVLRTYTLLRLLRTEWGGALIICCGLELQGTAVAMAANIAGAVCLSLEEEPELLKRALRSGSCDFIVNTLDEALRTMKNEVRKHLPLSVGLQGDMSSVLRECIERGVQPELIIDPGAEGSLEDSVSVRALIQQLRQLGAEAMSLDENGPDKGELDGFAVLDKFVRDRQWSLRSFRVNDAAGLRAFDAQALRLLREEDALRRQWLQSASRIVQRQRPLHRVLWATKEERQMLENVVNGLT